MRIVYFIILFTFVCNYAKNQGLSNSLADMNNVYGSKNLLPQTGEASSYHGVDFTVNSDGTVSFSGTITDDSTTYNYAVNEPVPNVWKGNTITFGVFKDIIADVYAGLYVYDSSNTLVAEIGTNGNTLKESSGAIPSNAHHYIVQIVFSNNRAISGTLYPMIRLASIQDDTYVPYSMTNREMTPYVQSISNPNLLDNPWFTVNQREFTTTTSSWVYISDRWMTGNTVTGSITKESDGTLTITGNTQIEELIEESRMEVGKTYTYSAMLYDNSIISETFVLPARTSSTWQQFVRKSINSLAIFGAYNDSNISFWIEVEGSATKRIKATKLELGSVSTLSMDSAPNYAEELLKCQRYFVRIKENGQWGANIIGSLYADGIICDLSLASTMRANPTMSVISYGTIHTSSNDYVPTSIHVDNLIGNIVRFFAMKPGLSFTNHTIANYEGVEFDLSADL